MVWKNLDMQLMDSFICNDGSQISIQEVGASFESLDTTFIMLDGGDKIAGRNLKEGWRMIAASSPGQSVYCVTLSYINREAKFTLGKHEFYAFVQQHFEKILKAS